MTPATRYAAVVDSGQKWLGEIPSHWQCLPHRTIFREIKDPGHPDEPMLSVTIGRGIIPQAELLASSSKKDSSNVDKSKYKLVQPDDIAYNKMRAWQGAIGRSAYRGIVSPAYIVQRLRSSGNAEYFHHLFRIPAFATEAERWSYGITSDQWSLRPEHFKMIYSCVPPVEEQDSIVRYLRHLDVRVSRFVANRRQLIAVLGEQRQALVQRAVTGGLDSDTATTASNVPWLGPVPRTWEVRPICRCLQSVVTGVWGDEPSEANESEHVVCVRVADFDMNNLRVSDATLTMRAVSASAQAERLLQHGDVLIEKSGGGDAQPVGRVVLFDHTFPAITSNFVSRLRVKPDVVRPGFLLLVLALLQSRRLNVPSIKQTTGIQNLDDYHYFAMRIPVPPVAEQDAIIAWVDREGSAVSAAVDRANREIAMMREYRTRLVTEVATGKLDVRKAAAELPSSQIDEAESLGVTEFNPAEFADEGDALLENEVVA